jgi:hypothetical protein
MVPSIRNWLSAARRHARLSRQSRRKYYIINAEALLPGDIIFSTERAAQSFAIRKATQSPYSHAAIYLGHSQYAEAVGLGVRVRAVSTILKEHIKVTRLAADSAPDPVALAARAAENVNYYLHSPYWRKGALLSIFRNAKVDERRSLFCSHLVARVYADAGFDVIDDREPFKITPGDLAESTKFRDVTKEVLEPARVLVAGVLDPEFTTLSDDETLRVEGMYAELVPFFEKNGLRPVPDSWELMVIVMGKLPTKAMRRALDVEVTKSMQNNKYLDLPTDGVARSIAPLEAYMEQKSYNALPKVAIESELRSLKQNLPALKRQLDIDQENSDEYGKLYRKTKLDSYRLLRDTKKAHAENVALLLTLTEGLITSLEARLEALG